MKILFITVGKKNDPALSDAISDFTSRIAKYADTEWKMVPADSIDNECRSILSSVSERDYVVLLDERGKEMDSKELSGFIEKRLNSSTHRLVFVIGGAYGVNEDVKNGSHAILALSKLTFPHQLVRLVLAEQIYRAFTILRGEKYHHS